MTKGVLKMSDIKKKILAVAVICTLSLSMAACSDKKSGSNEPVSKPPLFRLKKPSSL